MPQDVRISASTVNKISPPHDGVHLNLADRHGMLFVEYAKFETRTCDRATGRSIPVFASRDYAMRVWLDPQRLQTLGLTANDVVGALQRQNVQVASGVLNQPPVADPRAFQVAVTTQGRLADPAEFGNIVVKATNDATVLLKDVARIELAAQDYGTNSYLSKDLAVALAVFQRPGSNALATADGIRSAMRELGKRFPSGVEYKIVYDPTQ